MGTAGIRTWCGRLAGRMPLVPRLIRQAARANLARLPGVPVVLVTGSAGKTVTTALIDPILSTRYTVVANRHNDNVIYHAPNYILRLRRGANHALVLEVGIQTTRNADLWNTMIRPDIVVLTNIGHTHLQWLKDREGVFTEKLKLTQL